MNYHYKTMEILPDQKSKLPDQNTKYKLPKRKKTTL